MLPNEETHEEIRFQSRQLDMPNVRQNRRLQARSLFEESFHLTPQIESFAFSWLNAIAAQHR